MYHTYYGLEADPFRLSPDHAFCYRHPSFAKGRAYMQYALRAAEGFVVVTGMPGMGKTTLINDLLSDFGPSDYLIATLVITTLEANDLLRSVAYEFGINVENLDKATILQRLKQRFHQSRQAGKPPLLIVDEAQNLGLGALEELRLLTNLQLAGKPLLQIFLVGQEVLRDKLADPRLEQLRQRVTAAAHLQPLSEEQTAAYIIHRLRVVGWNNFPSVKASVLPIIKEFTEGVPRRINQFCSRLLLHGCVEEKAELKESDANLVRHELSSERLSPIPGDQPQLIEPQGRADAEPNSFDEASDEAVFAAAEQLLAKQKKIVVPRRRDEHSSDPRFLDGSPPQEMVSPGMGWDRPQELPPPSNRWNSPQEIPGPGVGWHSPQEMPPPGTHWNSPQEMRPPFLAERRHPLDRSANPFRRHRHSSHFGLALALLMFAGIVWATVRYLDEGSEFRRWVEHAQRDLFGPQYQARRVEPASPPMDDRRSAEPAAEPDTNLSESGMVLPSR